LGIAQGALDLAVEYSRQRKQFGKAICSFQGLQFMLADMATQVAAARYLTYEAARAADYKHPNVGAISAMAKLFASDTAMKVTTDAVQVFGGYGYMKEYPVEKMMRDAKITQIYEGTNQIQREVIALELIKESAKGGK
jgi:butyryl-CoA dehydrogenase